MNTLGELGIWKDENHRPTYIPRRGNKKIQSEYEWKEERLKLLESNIHKNEKLYYEYIDLRIWLDINKPVEG